MTFNDNELTIIWFALLMDQVKPEDGTDRWWRYERLIVRIEKELGASKRTYLKVVKTDE